MSNMGKIMIYAGIILIIAGLFFHFGSKILPLGKLPFDFKWESSNASVYFPLRFLCFNQYHFNHNLKYIISLKTKRL